MGGWVDSIVVGEGLVSIILSVHVIVVHIYKHSVKCCCPLLVLILFIHLC